MISNVDRKWSRRKIRNGMELLFVYLFIDLFNYFSASSNNLNKSKAEKMRTT